MGSNPSRLFTLSLFLFLFLNHIVFKMSTDPLFTIVGDTNVTRNMTGLNIASRPSMKSAQVIECLSQANFETALTDVRAESSVLIIACLTDFLLASGDCGTIFSSVDPVLATLVTKLSNFCAYRPNLKVRQNYDFF